MREINHVVVIFNPKSTKAKKGLVEKFQRQLARAMPGLKVTVHQTEGSGHAEQLVRAYASEAHAVVLSASGDGVYSEVINGILQSSSGQLQPLLGIIPSGNANDHHHAIASGSLVKNIKAGKSRPLDVLRIEYTDAAGNEKTRLAHSYIGLGLTSYIRKQLDEKKVNNFTEKIIATRAFVDSKPIKIKRLSETLELDSLLFTNIGIIAKFFKVKNSAPDDAKFEVHVLPHTTQLHKAGGVLRLSSKKKSTVRSRSTAYAFTLLEAESMQVDGEILKLAKNSRVVISLDHNAFRTVI